MLTDSKSKNGQSLVELCAGLVIAIPVFMLIMDGIGIAAGFQVNETTCREAARAAANGDPNSAETLAQSVVSRANDQRSWMVMDLHLVSVKNVVSPLSVPQADGSIPVRTVEIATAVDIKPMLLSRVTPKQFLTFTTKQSFPYTYVPPLAVPTASSTSASPSSK